MGYVFDELSRDVINAALAVHRALGPGFLESTYERALRIALEHRGLQFESQYRIHAVFEGVIVGAARIDFLVDKSLIVELKSVESLAPVHFAQVRAYLRATRLHVALLINFNAPRLTIRRILMD
ncbi:MAG TPA: GxxExxY protein [Gemmatimonadales bacterium]